MELAVGIFGIVIGVVASVLIGRYYYHRTVNKELSVYELLNSPVFAGIAPDVREQLHFKFKEREVTELQQVMFVVANTGDRAIRDLIETIRLDLPPTAAILDASIVHRHPDDLNATLQVTEVDPAEGSAIHFEFPLLNTKEFFIVKLLLSGRLGRISRLPPNSYDDKPYKIEWALGAFAVGVLTIPAWIGYLVYKFAELQPSLLPYPWTAYQFSWHSLFLLLPAGILVGGFSLLGLTMIAAAMFGGEFPPPKGPRFPLPKAVRAAVYPYPVWRFHPEFGQTPVTPNDGNVAEMVVAAEKPHGE